MSVDWSIDIGMRVRSFDFMHRRDCYVEGVVIAVGRVIEGCARYAIRCERRILAGQDMRQDVGRMFYPPVNGTPSLLGGVTNFVEEVRDGQ